MHFWLDVARVYGRVSLPMKTSLNWTMPALTNISVGSFCGTSGELGTTSCPRASKKSRNARRTSADVRAIATAAIARRTRLTRRLLSLRPQRVGSPLSARRRAGPSSAPRRALWTAAWTASSSSLRRPWSVISEPEPKVVAAAGDRALERLPATDRELDAHLHLHAPADARLGDLRHVAVESDDRARAARWPAGGATRRRRRTRPPAWPGRATAPRPRAPARAPRRGRRRSSCGCASSRAPRRTGTPGERCRASSPANPSRRSSRSSAMATRAAAPSRSTTSPARAGAAGRSSASGSPRLPSARAAATRTAGCPSPARPRAPRGAPSGRVCPSTSAALTRTLKSVDSASSRIVVLASSRARDAGRRCRERRADEHAAERPPKRP